MIQNLSIIHLKIVKWLRKENALIIILLKTAIYYLLLNILQLRCEYYLVGWIFISTRKRVIYRISYNLVKSLITFLQTLLDHHIICIFIYLPSLTIKLTIFLYFVIFFFRYSRPNVQNQLPGWISRHVKIPPKFGPVLADLRKFFKTKAQWYIVFKCFIFFWICQKKIYIYIFFEFVIESKEYAYLPIFYKKILSNIFLLCIPFYIRELLCITNIVTDIFSMQSWI